jgi:hypothetical protein
LDFLVDADSTNMPRRWRWAGAERELSATRSTLTRPDWVGFFQAQVTVHALRIEDNPRSADGSPSSLLGTQEEADSWIPYLKSAQAAAENQAAISSRA